MELGAHTPYLRSGIYALPRYDGGSTYVEFNVEWIYVESILWMETNECLFVSIYLFNLLFIAV